MCKKNMHRKESYAESRLIMSRILQWPYVGPFSWLGYHCRGPTKYLPWPNRSNNPRLVTLFSSIQAYCVAYTVATVRGDKIIILAWSLLFRLAMPVCIFVQLHALFCFSSGNPIRPRPNHHLWQLAEIQLSACHAVSPRNAASLHRVPNAMTLQLWTYCHTNNLNH